MKPFWWPDTRGWIVVGMFCLSTILIVLSATFPALMDHQLWVQLCTAIIITGMIGLGWTFYLSSSKGSADSNARADKALDIAANAQRKEGEQ